MKFLFTLCLALGFVAVAPLRSAAAETKYVYLAPNAVDVVHLLAPPPAAGSVENAADMASALAIYTQGTAADRARGKSEEKLHAFDFAAAVFGPDFTAEKFPATAALFAQVELETKGVVTVGKSHWQRIRPYLTDPARFPDAIEHEKSTDYSYPSGHSTRGTVFALLFAELVPEKREALLAKSRDSGWLRIQGGVHYPTDIYAGRVLGQALARAFLASPAFQEKFAAAKAELATAKL